MRQDSYSQYQQSSILTASPAKLLLMAYDGAIRFCRIASEKMKENKLDEQSININKAMAIVFELINTLREDVNPQLVTRLKSIYMYMIEKLAHANLYNDQEALDEVIRHLTNLRGTWAEAERIIQQDNQQQEEAA